MNIKEWREKGIFVLDGEDFEDPGTMLTFKSEMDKAADVWCEAVWKIAQYYDIDEEWALDIAFLRTRSRWTAELEARLVEMARNGDDHPKMCEWP